MIDRSVVFSGSHDWASVGLLCPIEHDSPGLGGWGDGAGRFPPAERARPLSEPKASVAYRNTGGI